MPRSRRDRARSRADAARSRPMSEPRTLAAVAALVLALGLTACAKGSSAGRSHAGGRSSNATGGPEGVVPGAGARGGRGVEVPRPGRVPPPLGHANVYAADRPGRFSPRVRGDRALVYVPNSESNTVDVISQRTFKVIDSFPVGTLPQHVVPAWNLRTLYVTNDAGNSLTPIDPRTGRPGRSIPVEDPYNMYFTPDGRHAIIVAERLHRLDFRNPHTFALQHSLNVPCLGV